MCYLFRKLPDGRQFALFNSNKAGNYQLNAKLKVLGKKRRVADETMEETERDKNTETNGGEQKEKKQKSPFMV